jgi:hypothetical protein
MELAGIIGIVVGALIGHIIAAAGVAGGSYAYVGGSVFEVTEDPMGCLQAAWSKWSRWASVRERVISSPHC